MRMSIVVTGTCARADTFRRLARPSLVACQPWLSNAPSELVSATTTTWPVVFASSRPLSSTIAPREPIMSTVRNAWCVASVLYDGPWRIWIDQARRTSAKMTAPTSTARPPMRT